MITRKLGVKSLAKYDLVEVIIAPNEDIVLIYMCKNTYQPTILAKIVYIRDGSNRFMAMFKAHTSQESVTLNSEANDKLEFESISIAEGIRKNVCM